MILLDTQGQNDAADDFFAATTVLCFGYANESPEQSSFAHLLEHVLAETMLLAGQPVRSLLFDNGLDVEARTFPLHIELTLSGSLEDASSSVDIIQTVLRIWRNPSLIAPCPPSVVAVAANTVREEVFERNARNRMSTIPWSAAPSLFSSGCRPGHDGFNNVSEILHVSAPDKLNSLLMDLALVDSRTAVLGPRWLTHWLEASMRQDGPPSACRGWPSLRTESPVRVELDGAALPHDVVCSVSPLNLSSNPSEGVAQAMVVDRGLRSISNTQDVWQLGSFGPLSGPDYFLMFHTFNEKNSSASGRHELLHGVDVEALSKASIDEFDSVLSSPPRRTKVAALLDTFGACAPGVRRALGMQGEAVPREAIRALLSGIAERGDAGESIVRWKKDLVESDPSCLT